MKCLACKEEMTFGSEFEAQASCGLCHYKKCKEKYPNFYRGTIEIRRD